MTVIRYKENKISFYIPAIRFQGVLLSRSSIDFLIRTCIRTFWNVYRFACFLCRLNYLYPFTEPSTLLNAKDGSERLYSDRNL